MKHFENRIRALEARMVMEAVILRFPDGSTKEISGHGDFLLSLFAGLFGGAELSPAKAAQLDLIRTSVAAEEPGGGHMVELMRCLLNGPAEEPSSLTPIRR
jgi:hypothetical protein